MSTAILSFIAFMAVLTSADNVINDDDGSIACEICHCFETEEGTDVDCSSLNLTNVPMNIPQRTVSLDLHNNQLKHLNETVFSNLPRLRKLLLDDNRLSALPGGIFLSVPHLEELYLNNNSLERIPEKLLINVSHLRILWLYGNMIHYLPAKLFEKTILLEEIQLYENLLEEIPEELLQNMPLLKLIYLDGNRIRRIPKDFLRNVSQLEVISFSRNMIQYTPPKLFQSTPLLQELYLDENLLETVPEDLLFNLPNLEVISFSRNMINYVPKRLFAKTTAVRKLHLDNNLLESLPDELFFNVPHLQALYLDNNSLLSLPKELLMGIPNLRIISLSTNQLKELPESLFAQNRQLIVIQLNSNKLEFIPSTIISITRKLRYLTISENQLTNLSEHTFSFPNNLEAIEMGSNRLRYIPKNIFSNAPMLKYLNLTKNQIRELPDTVLSNNAELIELYLQHNELQFLPRRLLAKTESLQTLNLSNNRLSDLSENFLANNRKLKKIDISNNCLKNLSENMFAFLMHLELLNLKNTCLEFIPERILLSTPKLTELYLHENKLKSIPTSLLQGSPNIKILYLTENRLISISKSLLQTSPNIKVLSLGKNQLRNLPESLFENKNDLAYIDLSDNHLTNITENIFSFSVKLENLYLDGNYLQYLPEQVFWNNFMLSSLDISKNRLRELPIGLFANNRNLKKVDMSDNLLVNLPEGIFSFPNKLEFIDLKNNTLQYVSENLFSNTQTLRLLYLQENNLTSIPKALLQSTPNLQRLDLSKNGFQDIPEGFFGRTTQLQHLHMPLNRIWELSEDILKNIEELKSLYLYGNYIAYLPETLFSNVTLTGVLDISLNSIEEIPLRLFNFNNTARALTELFLHGNFIKHLRSGVFRGLPNLRTLSLYENEIQIIETDVFFTSSVTMYLFGNKLDTFSYYSFKYNFSSSEIHLYRNRITAVFGNSSRISSALNILYIECGDLKDVRGINIQLNCVSANFTPEFRLSSEYIGESYMAQMLTLEGFNCTFNSTTKYYICTICPQGTYSNWENECVICPKGGFYQDEIGRISNVTGQFLCKNCTDGTYVKEDGGTSQKDCIVCPDGTNKSIHAGFRACFCNHGFARSGRFRSCFPCKQKGLVCSEDFQSLRPGYFWSWSFPNASIDEYNAFVENLLNKTRFYDKNTHYLKEIPLVHKCPRPASCISNFNESRSVGGTCAVGYKGWLCRKCVPGYYSVYNTCLHCPDRKILLIELAVLICVGTVVIYVIWWSYKRGKKRGSERDTTDIVASRVKIVLGFYQVIGEYLSSFNNVKLSGSMFIIGEIISVIEMNILKIFIRPQCFNEKLVINPKIEFLIALTAVFVLTSLPFLVYQISKVYLRIRCPTENRNGRLTNLKARMLSFVVGLVFITYPPVCTSIFQLFPGACEMFCLDLENKHCFTVLRSDYDVRCDEKLLAYQVFAVLATFGYVVAFPLALFYMLRKYCSVSVIQKNKGKKNTTTQCEDTNLLTKDSRHSYLPQCLKFLCENYKTDYWYWEIVELARKITQTVLITMLGWENKFTVLLTIGISVLFLTLHARHRPMKSVREQRLQMFSLIAILTNVVFIAVQMPNKYKDVSSLFLILLNISVIVVICVEVMFVVMVRCKNFLCR